MSNENSRISSALFGELPDGQKITRYTLENKSGASVEILDLGGIIVSLNVPDRDGKLNDIVLGLDDPAQYLNESPYFGAIVGRYANRIAKGKFSLEGTDYSLAVNNGPNALHGGLVGFDKKIWNVEPFEGADHAGLSLTMVSEDGEEGYPGTLKVNVSYKLDDDNNLTINYKASTDKTTVINLSQHTYFNLNGHNSGNILDHEVFLNAASFTPVDENLIPTGEIVAVENTPMDFRQAKTIGRDIGVENEQLDVGGGYDHNWVLDRQDMENMELAATVYEPTSGRFMEFMTDQPAIQFYTGNFLDGTVSGKAGYNYQYRGGLCLETQHFPDSPNQVNFPSTVLKAGEEYNTTTIFNFSVK